MATTYRIVLTNTPGGYPMSNVDIEMVRTDTMAIVELKQTGKFGEALFTTDAPAPVFFRPRIIGTNWRLQLTGVGVLDGAEDNLHVPVTLGAGSDDALTLDGQELTLADVLTPDEHTAIGDGAPHHAESHSLGSHTHLTDFTVPVGLAYATFGDAGCGVSANEDYVTWAFDYAADPFSISALVYSRDDGWWDFYVNQGAPPVSCFRITATGINVDTIAELTVNAGVTIEGVLLKDSIAGNYDFTAKPGTLYVGDANFELYLEAGGPVIVFDTGFDFLGYVRASNYFTFSIGGVSYLQLGTTGLLVDHILELTADHGVDIDGVLCKDDAVETDAIRGLRTTTGPTSLAMGAVADGEYLMRVGATIVGGTPAGGGGGFQDAFFLV